MKSYIKIESYLTKGDIIDACSGECPPHTSCNYCSQDRKIRWYK